MGTWASIVVAHGLSSCGSRPLHLILAKRPRSDGSRPLERRLSSCGAQVLLLRGMWDLPRPGLKPMSPALACRFLTTAPPGKPQSLLLYCTPLLLWIPGSVTTLIPGFPLPLSLPPPPSCNVIFFGPCVSDR